MNLISPFKLCAIGAMAGKVPPSLCGSEDHEIVAIGYILSIPPQVVSRSTHCECLRGRTIIFKGPWRASEN
jgi:hypothetical protein